MESQDGDSESPGHAEWRKWPYSRPALSPNDVVVSMFPRKALHTTVSIFFSIIPLYNPYYSSFHVLYHSFTPQALSPHPQTGPFSIPYEQQARHGWWSLLGRLRSMLTGGPCLALSQKAKSVVLRSCSHMSYSLNLLK